MAREEEDRRRVKECTPEVPYKDNRGQRISRKMVTDCAIRQTWCRAAGTLVGV